MVMDPATQAISRFVGVLDLIVDGDRLRQELHEFQRVPASEADSDAIPGISVKLLIGHGLPDYDPGLAYRPIGPVVKDAGGYPGYHDASLGLPLSTGAADADAATALPDGAGRDAGPVTVSNPPFAPDVPGSVVTVTVQLVGLTDDDLLLDGLGADFVSPSQLAGVLGGIDMLANTLKGFEMPDMPEMSGWMGFTKDILDQFDTDAATDVEAVADIHTARGDEVEGIIVDGAAAAEAPHWTDMLPAFHREDDEEPADEDSHDSEGSSAIAEGSETIVSTSSGIDDEASISRPTEHDISLDFPGRDGGDGAVSGHQAITGANTAINEVGVSSQWIDASIIVVGGDVAKVQAISQVNLMVNRDSINGEPVVQESTGTNIAEILSTSVPGSFAASADSDAAPSDWTVFRLEATLYQVNWVKQVTYITDYDRIEVTFSAQMTMLSTGENEIVNSTILNEYGYRFDVMFVAGDMVDATIISQKNVLHDSDNLTTTGGGDASGAGVSLADNLLYNRATIDTKGVDTFTDMTEGFANAAEDLAAGTNSLARTLTDEALLAGRDHVTALQIDGDLVRINVFEQENIIGDADQMRLDMARIQAELAAEASLIAGSNVLVNTATVAENGIDSVIMAGGDVYNDALIHQAEWFDEGAPADGVRMAELTNDAVAAFLSEELAGINDATEAIAPTTNYDNIANLDVMQGVLA